MNKEKIPYLRSVETKDQEHIVRRLIKGGKREMMPRELVDNAVAKILELLSLGVDCDKTVYIRGLKFTADLLDGINTSNYKLSFMQAGAMANIHEIQNIGGSAEKTLGDKDNFGMGSRTSTLNWGDLCYITRKDGKSLMCILGMRQNVVKVIIQPTDVSNWVEKNSVERNYPKGDFTEVILLGFESDMTQNTVQRPWLPKEPSKERSVPKNFYTASLFKRFAEMPVKIAFQKAKTEDGHTYGMGGESGTFARWFKTWHEKFLEANKDHPNDQSFYESVHAKEDNSIKLHYYFDGVMKNAKGEDQPITRGYVAGLCSTAFNGLIWKGNTGRKEYYDVADGSAKMVRDQNCGITGGQDHFRFFVELPTDKFEPTDDRTGLRYTDDLEEVSYSHFEAMLISNMSERLKKKIAEFSVARKSKNLDKELLERLKKLKNLARLTTKTVQGTTHGTTKTNNNSQNTKTNTGTGNKRKPYTHNNVLTVSKKNKGTGFDDNIQLIDYKNVDNNQIGPFIARLIQSKKSEERDTLLFNVQHELIDKILEELNLDEAIKVPMRTFVEDEIKLKLGVYCCLNKSLVDDENYEYSYTDYLSSIKDPHLLAQAITYEDILSGLRVRAKQLKDELKLQEETSSDEKRWQEKANVVLPKKKAV